MGGSRVELTNRSHHFPTRWYTPELWRRGGGKLLDRLSQSTQLDGILIQWRIWILERYVWLPQNFLNNPILHIVLMGVNIRFHTKAVCGVSSICNIAFFYNLEPLPFLVSTISLSTHHCNRVCASQNNKFTTSTRLITKRSNELLVGKPCVSNSNCFVETKNLGEVEGRSFALQRRHGKGTLTWSYELSVLYIKWLKIYINMDRM